MKRPPQHETDAAGTRLLQDAFEAFGWTVNKIEHDYGADFEIEIFENGATTGATFKVQLKSTKAPAYLMDGAEISHALRVDRGKYLAHELRVPTVLIVCDVTQRRVFWAMPQLNSSFAEKLLALADDQTLTLRLQVGDELPVARERFLSDLTKADALLSARATKRAPSDLLAEVHTDPEGLIAQYQAHADSLRLTLAYRNAIQGDPTATFARLNEVLANPQSGIDAKVRAWLIWEVAEQGRQIASGESDRSRLAIANKVASELRALTWDGPRHLRYFAAVYSLASEVSVLAHEGHALLMAERVTLHMEAGPLYIARQQWERRLHRALERSARIVNRLQMTTEAWALPIPISRLVMAIGIAALSFRIDGRIDVWNEMRAYAIRLAKSGRRIATAVRHDSGLSSIAAGLLVFSGVNPDKAMVLAVQMADSLPRGDEQDFVRGAIDRSRRLNAREKIEGRIRTTDRQIWENVRDGLRLAGGTAAVDRKVNEN